jgi:single-stranded-DNA-specific exonuclease
LVARTLIAQKVIPINFENLLYYKPMQTIWRVADPVPEAIAQQFPELNPIVLQLLWNRNLRTQNDIDEFLNPDWGKDIHDPFLFKDMHKAVERIQQAVAKGEKIIVHGDYDADGVCAAALLWTTLQALGAKVDVYLPHREREGYGLNLQTIDHLHKVHKAQLIITCDCGTSNAEEVERARTLGMDVIITDHHHEPLLRPKAFALINPQLKDSGYPFSHLAGSGVAFKLAQALIRKSGLEKIGQYTPEGFEKWLLDLVAISTVTDFMPLKGENRTLVKYGLVVLRKSPRPGLRAMAQAMSSRQDEIDTTTIGFQIGPRLNAAGRMDHASTAFRLLISSDEQEAQSLAVALNQSNQERQKLTEEIYRAAKACLGEVKDEDKILIVKGEGWPVGILGLVAGKLTDEYQRPALVMGKHDDEIVGSGRSIESYDITEALKRYQQYLKRFGGHAAACGFTLTNENCDNFLAAMRKDAKKLLKAEDLQKELNVDIEVTLPHVTWELFDALEGFEPFGEENFKPIFITRGMTITDLQPVGKEGKHLRVVVNHVVPEPRKFIGFGIGQTWGKRLAVGDKIDVAFTVDRNEWNGTRELQLKILDIHIDKV